MQLIILIAVAAASVAGTPLPDLINNPLEDLINNPLPDLISNPLSDLIKKPFPDLINNPLPNLINNPLPELISKSDRIIGGRNTSIEEVPHQISLQYYGSHTCGGSIISKDWIVTAGHCVTGTADRYAIRAGSSYNNKGGTSHNASRVIRHQGFSTTDQGIPTYDIALIRVTPPFVLNKTRQAIKLFDLGEPAPAKAISTITGWGRTENGSAPVLQLVTIPIVTKIECSKSYEQYGGIPDGQICAAYPEGGKDSCQGDSGGPLTIGGRLAGIVSWGYGCAVPGNPGVYTEIAAYRFWIKSNTGI